ncbi:MAG: glycosyltransferase family 4 protein [Desulfovibrio sp.]|jgi:glycosyltransferase involved in cell wall biosynthesis|nr:glycosyltransferase family 4 protein [Desulfovibrio sp.]
MVSSPSSRPRIWCTLDAFVEGGSILGRRVANSTFLRALLRADPFDGYHFFLPGTPDGEALSRWLEEHFPALLRRGAIHIKQRTHLDRHLATVRYHCLHLSDPVSHYTQAAQLRNALAPFLFPLTGTTHSLSYARFMPEYARHLWPGVSPRDAILATSESARQVLNTIFSDLRRAYGLDPTDFPSPRAVLLPLGVEREDLPDVGERWENGPSPGRAMRDRLNLGEEVVFLCLARLSPYSKMDALPLFSALRRAESLGLPPDRCALILAGWAEEGDALPEALLDYAAGMGLRARLFPRPGNEERRALYAAADVFVSPSDNIQETFGLTVAEAGGASLPVIASDFDGYRDIVVHGETGLLIPTIGFAQTTETELRSLFWFDNQYHLALAQQTVVEPAALAAALARLGTDAALRRRLGLAARERVLRLYAWDQIITRMVDLWDELAALPLSPEEESRIRAAVHPLRMSFARSFQAHFSRTLGPETLAGLTLRATAAGAALYREVLPLPQYAGMEHLLDKNSLHRMLLAARKPIPAALLLDRLAASLAEALPHMPPPLLQERASFSLLWALKHDYLEQA